MNKQILKLKNQKKSDSVKIIALVGLAGSGKSTATNYLKQKVKKNLKTHLIKW